MKNKIIWVNTLVKNEERYLWYSVTSVIKHVDKILLWDTGSTDKTLEIIKLLQKENPEKIDFKEAGDVDINQFTMVRQEMLDATKSDWIIILDGDEIWWDKSIAQLVDNIQREGDKLETIVSPYYNIIGDIYHYQEEVAGGYVIDKKSGHINIRALNRKIPGLHLEKPHGQQGFYDNDGVLIQNRNRKFRKFLNYPYFHFTNMTRSSTKLNDSNVPKRWLKYKYELGIPFPQDFKYPEAFYLPRPEIVPSPWERMSNSYRIRAIAETALKKAKRRILPFKKVGY